MSRRGQPPYNDPKLQFQYNICEQGWALQRTAGRCMKIEATRQKELTDINDGCILTGVKHSNIIVFYLPVFAIYKQKKEELKTTSTQIFLGSYCK